MIGKTLSHFKITAKLGEGGMGEVYRALDTKLDREVALKVLPAELAADSERLDRFKREAKALAALDDPGIVTIYSVDQAVLGKPDLRREGHDPEGGHDLNSAGVQDRVPLSSGHVPAQDRVPESARRYLARQSVSARSWASNSSSRLRGI